MPRGFRLARQAGFAARPVANPKIGELVGARQRPAEPGCRAGGSGGGLEGDGVAEGFELADVAELAAFGVDAGGVVAGAEVVEVRVGVGEQVPGDHQDRAAEGDDGALGAAAAGDPPVLLPEERVGLGWLPRLTFYSSGIQAASGQNAAVADGGRGALACC
jgi:hypothetical protein